MKNLDDWMKENNEKYVNTYVTANTGWDTSSKEQGYLHNHWVDAIAQNCEAYNNMKVSDLTVGELKRIIEDTVSRLIIRIPTQTFPTYTPPEYPWQQQVWCSSEGPKC